MLCIYLNTFLIYRDNPCEIGGVDQWMYVKMQIGKTSHDTIKMGN